MPRFCGPLTGRGKPQKSLHLKSLEPLVTRTLVAWMLTLKALKLLGLRLMSLSSGSSPGKKHRAPNRKVILTGTEVPDDTVSKVFRIRSSIRIPKIEGRPRTSPPSKKVKKADGPLDPQDAIHDFGWTQIDLGGDGDCFYRCAAFFIEKEKPFSPDKNTNVNKAKSAAAWIRSRTVQHARKSAGKFRSLFDAQELFENWLMTTAEPTTWIQGVARRLV